MTTICMERSNQGSFPWRYIALILMGIVIVLFASHAFERHGLDAVEVRACLDNNGAIGHWINPATGREALICQVDSGKFGLQIVKRGREVTAFVKEKMSRLEQVFKYLENRGYIPK